MSNSHQPTVSDCQWYAVTMTHHWRAMDFLNQVPVQIVVAHHQSVEGVEPILNTHILSEDVDSGSDSNTFNHSTGEEVVKKVEKTSPSLSFVFVRLEEECNESLT